MSRTHDRALALARESGDDKLARLVELAIVSDRLDRLWVGSVKLATAEQRWSARRVKWLRVWKHLAGVAVPILGNESLRAEDGALWLTATLHRGPQPTDVESGWGSVAYACSSVIQSGAILGRWHVVSAKNVRAFVKAAGMLGSEGVCEISWGGVGQPSPPGRLCRQLPPDPRAARQEARSFLEVMEHTVRRLIHTERRVRLAQHADHLVIYLLKHGHGAVKSRGGWRRAAQAYFGWEKPPLERGGASPTNELRTIRHHYESACALIAQSQSHPKRQA